MVCQHCAHAETLLVELDANDDPARRRVLLTSTSRFTKSLVRHAVCAEDTAGARALGKGHVTGLAVDDGDGPGESSVEGKSEEGGNIGKGDKTIKDGVGGMDEIENGKSVECVGCRARLAREAAEARRVENIRRQWRRLRDKMTWLRLRLRVWLLRRVLWGLTRSQLQAELAGSPTPGCPQEVALKATRADPRYAVRVVNSLAGIGKAGRSQRRSQHRNEAATLAAYDWCLAALSQCYYPGVDKPMFPIPAWELRRLQRLKEEAPPPPVHEAAASLFQNQDSSW